MGGLTLGRVESGVSASDSIAPRSRLRMQIFAEDAKKAKD